MIDAQTAEVSIEIPQRRRQRERLDAGCLRPFRQCRDREVAGRIVVAHQIETAKHCREEKGGEVIGGERSNHGQVRQNASDGEHGLDAFASHHDVGHDTEPDARLVVPGEAG